jgi:hypothetical protein
VEAVNESVSLWIVGGHPQEMNGTELGQGLEEFTFRLTSLDDGDGLRVTEAGYPGRQ